MKFQLYRVFLILTIIYGTNTWAARPQCLEIFDSREPIRIVVVGPEKRRLLAQIDRFLLENGVRTQATREQLTRALQGVGLLHLEQLWLRMGDLADDWRARLIQDISRGYEQGELANRPNEFVQGLAATYTRPKQPHWEVSREIDRSLRQALNRVLRHLLDKLNLQRSRQDLPELQITDSRRTQIINLWFENLWNLGEDLGQQVVQSFATWSSDQQLYVFHLLVDLSLDGTPETLLVPSLRMSIRLHLQGVLETPPAVVKYDLMLRDLEQNPNAHARRWVRAALDLIRVPETDRYPAVVARPTFSSRLLHAIEVLAAANSPERDSEINQALLELRAREARTRSRYLHSLSYYIDLALIRRGARPPSWQPIHTLLFDGNHTVLEVLIRTHQRANLASTLSHEHDYQELRASLMRALRNGRSLDNYFAHLLDEFKQNLFLDMREQQLAVLRFIYYLDLEGPQLEHRVERMCRVGSGPVHVVAQGLCRRWRHR